MNNRFKIIAAILALDLTIATVNCFHSCSVETVKASTDNESTIHNTMPKSPIPETTQPLVEVVFTETVTEYTSVKEGDKLICRCTHYCPCEICCQQFADGRTATGKVAAVGMVACNWLPLGSVIEIDGQRYTVEDRGGSSLDIIGRIDIFCNTHEEALNAGVTYGYLTVVSVG